MKIEVVGLGWQCSTCIMFMKNLREAVAETGVAAEVVTVSDMARIAEFGITATPGLVIDGVVKSAGRVPSKAEMIKWITGNG